MQIPISLSMSAARSNEKFNFVNVCIRENSILNKRVEKFVYDNKSLFINMKRISKYKIIIFRGINIFFDFY